MSEYTKGPWEWVGSDHYGYSALWNPETRHEVLVTGGINDGDDPITWMGEELTDGDKSLIASAPELLEALESLGCVCQHGIGNPMVSGHSAQCEAVSRAIAKAKGES